MSRYKLLSEPKSSVPTSVPNISPIGSGSSSILAPGDPPARYTSTEVPKRQSSLSRFIKKYMSKRRNESHRYRPSHNPRNPFKEYFEYPEDSLERTQTHGLSQRKYNVWEPEERELYNSNQESPNESKYAPTEYVSIESNPEVLVPMLSLPGDPQTTYQGPLGTPITTTETVLPATANDEALARVLQELDLEEWSTDEADFDGDFLTKLNRAYVESKAIYTSEYQENYVTGASSSHPQASSPTQTLSRSAECLPIPQEANQWEIHENVHALSPAMKMCKPLPEFPNPPPIRRAESTPAPALTHPGLPLPPVGAGSFAPLESVNYVKTDYEEVNWFHQWLTGWYPCTICTHALSPARLINMGNGFHSDCTNCKTPICPACLRRGCSFKCIEGACSNISHCRLSRPLYLYKVLVELDRFSIAERNDENIRNNTRKSQPPVILPGSGVGFGDDMADYGAFNAQINVPSSSNQSDTKGDRRDKQFLRFLLQIDCALKWSGSEPYMLGLMQQSSLRQTLEGLLRNDSISECSARAELYTALLDVLESMANNSNLTVFCTGQRVQNYSGANLESTIRAQAAPQGIENVTAMGQVYCPWSYKMARASSPPSLGIIDLGYPAVFGFSRNDYPVVTQSAITKPVARSSGANQNERSPSLLDIMGNLAKQAETFLKTSGKLTEDLDGLVVICTRIIHVQEALRGTTGQEMHTSNVRKPVRNSAESYRLACLELVYDEAPSAQIPFYHSYTASSVIASNAKRTLTLGKELSIMATSLPPGIFVRNLPNRPDCIKVLLAGPEGTPYYGGLFEFDIFAPANYPAVAPQIQLITTAGGQVRFNPNLYANGTVCLSLIGTWPGSPEEQWQPYKSTIMQILISIQSMLLCSRPYFNEPGIGVPADSWESIQYNKEIRLQTVKVAICDWMISLNSTNLWKDVIKMHFTQMADDLNRDFQACVLNDTRFRNYLSSSMSICGAVYPANAVANYNTQISKGEDLISCFTQGLETIKKW